MAAAHIGIVGRPAKGAQSRRKAASTKNAVEAGRVAMLSRRRFLNSALGAGAALAASRASQAVAQGGGRMIVDAQVHLWKAESPD